MTNIRGAGNMVSYYNTLAALRQQQAAGQQQMMQLEQQQQQQQQQHNILQQHPVQQQNAGPAAAIDVVQQYWYPGYGHPQPPLQPCQPYPAELVYAHPHYAHFQYQQHQYQQMPEWNNESNVSQAVAVREGEPSPSNRPGSSRSGSGSESNPGTPSTSSSHNSNIAVNTRTVGVNNHNVANVVVNNSNVGVNNGNVPVNNVPVNNGNIGVSNGNVGVSNGNVGVNNGNMAVNNNGGNNHVNNGPMRPAQVRSPYEWMKKTAYQVQPNPACDVTPICDPSAGSTIHEICTIDILGKTRTKDKYRVVYTDHQRLELEKEFHYSRYITIRRKSELATHLALSERQVKIWFQNRRAKERKQMKKREGLELSLKDSKPSLESPPTAAMANLTLTSMGGMLGGLMMPNGAPPHAHPPAHHGLPLAHGHNPLHGHQHAHQHGHPHAMAGM